MTHRANAWGKNSVMKHGKRFGGFKEFPQTWQPLGGAIRRCQMRRFPFGIIYEPSEHEIVIIAIAHLHRQPQYWRGRIESDKDERNT